MYVEAARTRPEKLCFVPVAPFKRAAANDTLRYESALMLILHFFDIRNLDKAIAYHRLSNCIVILFYHKQIVLQTGVLPLTSNCTQDTRAKIHD